VLWKCAWQDPVAIEVKNALASPVTVNVTTLTFGGKSVDIEDAVLSASLAQALREMLAVLKKG
jgi:hypothetical protein